MLWKLHKFHKRIKIVINLKACAKAKKQKQVVIDWDNNKMENYHKGNKYNNYNLTEIKIKNKYKVRNNK